MNNFFATPEGAWGDGSVHLTITGIVIVVVIIALLLIIAAFVRQKNASRKAALTTKQLVYSAVAIALAVVCSMIKLFEMPMGGSVTLLSMLFIVLIAYWYGPYVGIMTAVAYGLVQFVTEPIFYTIPQMLLDYPLAFGALGLAGFSIRKMGTSDWICSRRFRTFHLFHDLWHCIFRILCTGRHEPDPLFFRISGLLSGTGSSHYTDHYQHTAGCQSTGTRKTECSRSIKSKNSHTVFISKRYDCFFSSFMY